MIRVVLQSQMFSFEGWRLLLYPSFDVLHEGLAINIYFFFRSKKFEFFSTVKFYNFCHQVSGSGSAL
jgi:hypothetical protein